MRTVSDPPLGRFHCSALVGWMRCNGTQEHNLISLKPSLIHFLEVYLCIFVTVFFMPRTHAMLHDMSATPTIDVTFYLATQKETFHKASVS